MTRLTVEQLELYRKYGGDDDGFSRVATPAERRIMSGVDWARVLELVQLADLLNRDDTSAQLKREAQEKIRAACSNADAVDLLSQLARRAPK